MKRFWIVVLIVALFAIGGYFLWTGVPGQTPPGQPPLVEIKSAGLDAIKADFNREADSVRVIALFSPT